jgi:transposase
MDNFRKKLKTFGTLAVITNLNSKVTPENVFHYWKTRNDIKQVYGTLKNPLDTDTPYLSEEHQLEGWMFVNFLAIMLWYRLLQNLKKAELHGRYSTENILKTMLEIRQLKIGKQWKLATVPEKYIDLMKKI